MEYFWSGAQQDNKKWVLQKSVRRICFGSPGHIDEWVDYDRFETEIEAEEEKKRLDAFKYEGRLDHSTGKVSLVPTKYRIVHDRKLSYNVK